ncbi:HAD hydrolase family protein [Clostridium sp. A1-XYC3]|uniref:HAD hydrolase family protein n=1 Tax=Clostridium tanneri TaxID=3037988 RepID=A0ABU4JQZ4_9CLOT|nr:HAD hydrolase family protein [Clostridium sp. A1-XYC3]MDW8800559.1 HAD hydrolase family protein [Clostridium sp. A1-XYC3]
MIQIDIPGRKNLVMENIVFDYNGTLAVDGNLPEDVKEALIELAKRLNVYIITADTYGNVRSQCSELSVKVQTFPKGNATVYKREFVEKLGAENTVAVGNGLNDIEMFKAAELSIAIIGEEGCSTEALINSHIVVKDIKDVFSMILKVDRIRATLRD